MERTMFRRRMGNGPTAPLSVTGCLVVIEIRRTTAQHVRYLSENVKSKNIEDYKLFQAILAELTFGLARLAPRPPPRLNGGPPTLAVCGAPSDSLLKRPTCLTKD